MGKRMEGIMRAYADRLIETRAKDLQSTDVECRAPTLGSTVHHVSVPGSVADTHRTNKINIKNHTFIDNGETHTKFILHNLGHWPDNIHQSSNPAVL
jgi:hypothetical protein